jgi:hypothetical protein
MPPLLQHSYHMLRYIHEHLPIGSFLSRVKTQDSTPNTEALFTAQINLMGIECFDDSDFAGGWNISTFADVYTIMSPLVLS